MYVKRPDGTKPDSHGQLVPDAPKAPKDVPEIVDGYINIVGKLVHDFGKKRAEELKPADIKNIIALGRSIAMLQVIEVNKLASVGNKPVAQLTTEEIRARLAADTEEQVVEATYVEAGEDDE